MEKLIADRGNHRYTNVICIVLCIFMIMPVLIYTFYSVPAYDDFSNSYSVRILLDAESSYLSVAMDNVVQVYTGQSGFYLSAFLHPFLSPFLRSGIMGLRLFNFAVWALFFLSLLLSVKAVTTAFSGKGGARVFGLRHLHHSSFPC